MKLLRLLLLIIFCLCFGPQAIPGSIKDIKGTWDILLPEHRLALSPALGALAIESHYIKKLYYFGNPNHATTQLVKVIFHAFNGGFQPSKHNMPTPLCSIKTIAKILTTISQNYGLPVDLLKEQLIKTLLSDEDFNTEFMNKNNGLTFSQAQEEYNIYQKELSRTEKLAQHYNNIKERANNYLRSKQLVTRGIGDDFELIAKLETILSTKENPSTEEKSTEKAKKRKRIDLPNVAELRKVFDAKNRRTQLSSLLAKNPFNSIINFADLIARSCNECQSQSPSSSSSRSSSSSSSSSSSVATNQNYEGYATEHILLALLYKKSLTRQDFATYFQELPKEFLALKATDDWVNDSYEPNAHKKIRKALAEELNNIITTTESIVAPENIFTSLTKNEFDFANLIYAEIMNQKYGQPIPYLPEFGTVNFGGVVFNDCVETTIRNLCNAYTYNQQDRTFGNNAYEEVVFSQKLHDFYEKSIANRLEDETQHPTVRQDWSENIENLPLITYAKIKLPESKNFVDASEINSTKPCGFIRLTDQSVFPNEGIISSVTITLDNKKVTFATLMLNDFMYILVPTGVYEIFEIRTSLQNIIIILDSLLGLKLFASQDEPISSSSSSSSSAASRSDLEQQFFDPTFNSTHFRRLCAKLNWELDDVEDSDLNNNNAAETIISIIKKTTQSVTKPTDAASFSLILLPYRHAYAVRTTMATIREEYEKYLNMYIRKNFFTNPHPFIFIFANLYQYKLPLPQQETIDQGFDWRFISLFFTYNFLEPQVKLEGLTKILARYKIPVKENIISLVAQLIDSFELEQNLNYHNKISFLFIKYKVFFEQNQKNQQLQEILKNLCQKIIAHSAQIVKLRILVKFADLAKAMNNKTMIDSIKKQAMTSITNQNPVIYLEAIKLCEKLCQIEETFIKQATTSAKKYSQSTRQDLRRIGCGLFKALVKYRQAIEPAIEAAQNNSRHDNLSVRSEALDLFKVLIEHNQAFELAASAAEFNITNENENIQTRSLELYKSLVEKDYQPIFDAAITNALKDNEETLDTRFDILRMLVEKGYSMAYDPAIALAMKTIEAANDNYLVISSVLDLLNALVEKKIAVDQAVRAATIIKTESFDLLDSTFFETLFTTDQQQLGHAIISVVTEKPALVNNLVALFKNFEESNDDAANQARYFAQTNKEHENAAVRLLAQQLEPIEELADMDNDSDDNE